MTPREGHAYARRMRPSRLTAAERKTAFIFTFTLTFFTLLAVGVNLARGRATRVPGVLLVILLGCVMLVHLLHNGNRASELTRVIVVEGAAIGFTITFISAFVYGELQPSLKLPGIDASVLFFVVTGALSVGCFITWLRHR